MFVISPSLYYGLILESIVVELFDAAFSMSNRYEIDDDDENNYDSTLLPLIRARFAEYRLQLRDNCHKVNLI